MCPNCDKNVSLKKYSFVVMTLVLVACSVDLLAMESNKGHIHMNHDHSKASKEKNRKLLNESSKKSVLRVLEINEKLHNAFFSYDGQKVEIEALKLSKAISKIQDKEIAKLLQFSQTKLSQIKASNDRESNNKNYNLISMALIHIINKYDIGSDYNAYSCPMVKKKWVQNSHKMAKVHNPYAPEMPHCGSQDSEY